MPRRTCPRHGNEHPCTCAMGNLYRFVEPVLLLLLKEKGRSYGYELASDVRKHALTDAEIEVSALYRTLRQLEQNSCVTSKWDVEGSGDIKPYFPQFDCFEVARSGWLKGATLGKAKADDRFEKKGK